MTEQEKVNLPPGEQGEGTKGPEGTPGGTGVAEKTEEIKDSRPPEEVLKKDPSEDQPEQVTKIHEFEGHIVRIHVPMAERYKNNNTPTCPGIVTSDFREDIDLEQAHEKTINVKVLLDGLGTEWATSIAHIQYIPDHLTLETVQDYYWSFY